MLNPPNRRGTDPYARWCGRGGIARCPPIPIDAAGAMADPRPKRNTVARPLRRLPAMVSFLSRKPALSLDGRNRSSCPRLWENVWDEAADALCFPARQLGCRIDRLTRCGLNEAIRS